MRCCRLRQERRKRLSWELGDPWGQRPFFSTMQLLGTKKTHHGNWRPGLWCDQMLFGARFGIINYTPCSTSLCTFICINICHPPPSAIAVWWSYQNSSLPRFVCRRILGDLSNTQCQVQSPSQEGYPDVAKIFGAPTFDEEMLKSRFSYFKSAAVLMLSHSSHNCGNASLEHKMHEGGTVWQGCGITLEISWSIVGLLV